MKVRYMANIERFEGKGGPTFRVTMSRGDSAGKKILHCIAT